MVRKSDIYLALALTATLALAVHLIARGLA